ncbi:F-box only protein 21-like isoform X3 [Linepithema humile]|uniref:F-box only protein 21-like isoform X3 n=1 Tax=Linepithema humile TaxID=83485 RepID=UPI0006232C66|nr:PREDICTED: F-box only protein 21-like isoform X4 [Linepithema humile]
MAIITDLPIDVIIIILCDESISFKDIMSLALSFNFNFYNSLIELNTLWRKKFYQRWPHLREEYNEQLCLENKGFFEQVKAGVKSKKELWHYLSLMSEKHYYKDDLFDVDFRDFDSLIDPDKGAYFMNYYFFVNELRRLLTESPMESDLTQRYYAEKLLSYLQRYRLRKKVHEFINYPEKQQILEKALFSFAQWYQPEKYVSYSYVLKDKVGNAIILATIYHSVARRLGIRCDIIFRKRTNDYFLCWRPKYHTTKPKEKECFCIDFMRNGQMSSRNDCPIINSAEYGIDEYTKESPVEVMSYMNANLDSAIKNNQISQQSHLELQCLIKPDTRAIHELGNIYIRRRMDLASLIVILEKIQDNCKISDPIEASYAEKLLNKFRNHVNPVMPFCDQIIPKQRTTNIKFAVGMIVRFNNNFFMSEYLLKLIAVIIGWDERRKTYSNIREIIPRLFLNEASLKPHYKILCHDGTKYYVSEMYLTMCNEASWINYKDIGRYFCKFEHSYYVPNKMLEKHYPHDKLKLTTGSPDITH